MEEHVLDYAQWSELFPELTATQTQVESAWLVATVFVGDVDNCIVSGDKLQALLNYATAHVVAIMYGSGAYGEGASDSTGGGIVQSAHEGSVSVTYAKPPSGNQWEYYWNQTPYGTMFLAMLKALTAGGMYVGGKPETLAFRDVGGTW